MSARSAIRAAGSRTDRLRSCQIWRSLLKALSAWVAVRRRMTPHPGGLAEPEGPHL